MNRSRRHPTLSAATSTLAKCVLGALLSFTIGELTFSAKQSFAARRPSAYRPPAEAKLVDVVVGNEKDPYHLHLILDAKRDLVGMKISGGSEGTEDLSASMEDLEDGFPLKKYKKIITVTKLTAHDDFSTQTGGKLDLMVMRSFTNRPDLVLEMVRNDRGTPLEPADDTWDLYAHFPAGLGRRSKSGPDEKLPKVRAKINQLYFGVLVSDDKTPEDLNEGPGTGDLEGIKLVGGSLDGAPVRIMNTKHLN